MTGCAAFIEGSFARGSLVARRQVSGPGARLAPVGMADSWADPAEVTRICRFFRQTGHGKGRRPLLCQDRVKSARTKAGDSGGPAAAGRLETTEA